MRVPDPPTPPTPDRCTQGKKQPACRRLFVSPSSFAPPRASSSWSFSPPRDLVLAGLLAPSCRSSPLSDSATRVRAKGRRQSGRDREGDLFRTFGSLGRSLLLAPAFDPNAVHILPYKSRPLGGLSLFVVHRRGSRRFCDRFHAFTPARFGSKVPRVSSIFGLCRNAREDLDEKSLPLPTSSGGRRKVVS